MVTELGSEKTMPDFYIDTHWSDWALPLRVAYFRSFSGTNWELTVQIGPFKLMWDTFNDGVVL